MDDQTTAELLNLKKLHDEGVLKDDEFEARRTKLMLSHASAVQPVQVAAKTPLSVVAAAALFAQCGAVWFDWMTFHSNMKGGGRTSTAYGNMDSTFDVDGTIIALSGLQHWTGQLGLLLAIGGLVLVFQRSRHLKVLSLATAVFAAAMVFLLIPEATLGAGSGQVDGSFANEFGSLESSATLKSWFEPAIGAWVYAGASLILTIVSLMEPDSWVVWDPPFHAAIIVFLGLPILFLFMFLL